MKHVCSLCDGSGQVNKVSYRISMIPHPKDGVFEVVDTGETKGCPGCDGSGTSIRAKILNGEISEAALINITDLCRAAIDKFPKEAELFKAGKTKVIGRLIKDVLEASDGKADPVQVNKQLQEMLA